MEKKIKSKQALPGEAGGEDIRVSQSLTAATLFTSPPTVSALQAIQIQTTVGEDLIFHHIHVFKVAALPKKKEKKMSNA